MLTQTRDMIKWLLGVFSTCAFLLACVWIVEAFQPGTRASAQKEAILRQHFDRLPASVNNSSGKGSSTLNVSINEGDLSTGGVLQLKATIEAHADVRDLKYQWVLPQGTSMASGADKGDLGAITAGESTTLEGSFLVPTGENKQIHLQVYSEVNGEKMGDVAQYNSTEQPEIERSLASKRERLEAEISEGAQKPHLIH